MTSENESSLGAFRDCHCHYLRSRYGNTIVDGRKKNQWSKSIIDRYYQVFQSSFLSNKTLENKIQQLEEKLNKKQLTLDYRIKNDGNSRAVNLRVVSTQDESVVIVDANSFKMSTSIFVDKFTNRLDAIESKIDFLAFIVNAVLRSEIAHMGKSFVAPIKIKDLRFECANKDRPASVSFKYNKDSDSRYEVSGSGVFEQQEYSTSIQFRAWTDRIRIDASSIRVYKLPKNVWFEIETESGYRGYIDMILYVGLSGEYEHLTIKESKEVAVDFYNMLEFARNH